MGEPFRERQDAAESECRAAVEQAQVEWRKACEREEEKVRDLGDE